MRAEARLLEGSLFWKKVAPYVYLVQKVQGKQTYLGARSAQTEAQFEAFRQKKSQLWQRARSLKESVASCQRLNKAVRAGAVPSSVVKVLRQLEETGLSEGSVVLGTSALHAYGQPAGVRLEQIAASTQGSVVEDAKHYLRVLLFAPQRDVIAALPQLRVAADAQLDVTPAGESGERAYVLLEFKFAGKDEPLACRTKDSCWRALATQTAAEIQRAGIFQQVVIGKTGTMATMRTLDPRFFAMMSHAIAEAGATPGQDARWAQCQAALVDAMVADHLLVPKLSAAECRGTVDEMARRVFMSG